MTARLSDQDVERRCGMDLTSVERDFKEKVCSQVNLVREGVNRYRVLNPFLFDDGDHLSIVMKRENDEWVLSDEGHTYMHLSYDLDDADLQKGTRQKIISNVLSFFEVLDRQGELVMPVRDDLFGDTLFSFAQALLKVFDVGYLSRERVVSTFLEDFKTFMQETLPAGRLTFDWSDAVKDPNGMYKVDCRVSNGQAPLFVQVDPSVKTRIGVGRQGLDRTAVHRLSCWAIVEGGSTLAERIPFLPPTGRRPH